MRMKLLCMVVGVVGVGGLSASSTLAQGTVVSATAEVALTSNGDEHTYHYSIQNGRNSTGRACWIELDVSPVASLSPGLTAQDEDSDGVMLASPVGWTATVEVSGSVLWMSAREDAEIGPGTKLQGFELTTGGLPGIRTIRVTPYVPEEDVPADPDDANYAQLQESLLASRSTTIRVIGPVSKPTQVDGSSFLVIIQGYLNEGLRMGWAVNGGLVQSIRAKLNAAASSLRRADRAAAFGQLRATLRELRAQTGNQISVPFVELLSVNVEFLLNAVI